MGVTSLFVDVWTSAFGTSGGMPSGPAALPDLRDLMAFMVSCFVGGLVLTSNSCVAGGMSGGADDGVYSESPYIVSLKCAAHLTLCSSSFSDRGSGVACMFSRQHSCDLIESLFIGLTILRLSRLVTMPILLRLPIPGR